MDKNFILFYFRGPELKTKYLFLECNLTLLVNYHATKIAQLVIA